MAQVLFFAAVAIILISYDNNVLTNFIAKIWLVLKKVFGLTILTNQLFIRKNIGEHECYFFQSCQAASWL